MGRFDRWSHDGAPSSAALAEINRQITQAMAETLQSPPNNFSRDQNISPVQGAGGEAPRRGNGWAQSQPLNGSVPYQDAIERLCDALEPHSPEYVLKQARLTPDQLKQLKEMVARRPDLKWLDEMLDRVLPHGPESPLRKGKG